MTGVSSIVNAIGMARYVTRQRNISSCNELWPGEFQITQRTVPKANIYFGIQRSLPCTDDLEETPGRQCCRTRSWRENEHRPILLYRRRRSSITTTRRSECTWIQSPDLVVMAWRLHLNRLVPGFLTVAIVLLVIINAAAAAAALSSAERARSGCPACFCRCYRCTCPCTCGWSRCWIWERIY